MNIIFIKIIKNVVSVIKPTRPQELN